VAANGPLARDPALVPLSWGHQRGLRLARLLLNGEADARDVERAWTADLGPHFEAEEELLFPVSNVEHVARVRADHAWLRAARDELARRPGDRDLVDAFAAVLRAHIRYEERVWFEALQAVLGREKLVECEAEMHRRLPDLSLQAKETTE